MRQLPWSLAVGPGEVYAPPGPQSLLSAVVVTPSCAKHLHSSACIERKANPWPVSDHNVGNVLLISSMITATAPRFRIVLRLQTQRCAGQLLIGNSLHRYLPVGKVTERLTGYFVRVRLHGYGKADMARNPNRITVELFLCCQEARQQSSLHMHVRGREPAKDERKR